jgi:hypothetical protein
VSVTRPVKAPFCAKAGDAMAAKATSAIRRMNMPTIIICLDGL